MSGLAQTTPCTSRCLAVPCRAWVRVAVCAEAAADTRHVCICCRRGWRQPIQCFAAADGAMGAAAMQEGGGGGEQQAFEIENMW